MGKYFTAKDINLFTSINKELIDGIIDTKVNVYKLNLYEANIDLYNENLNKIYYEAIPLCGLIERDETILNYDTNEITQTIKVKFLKQSLMDIDLVVDLEDVIEHNDRLFKIIYVSDNQFLGGRVENKYSIICHCVLSRDSLDRVNNIKRQIQINTPVDRQQNYSQTVNVPEVPEATSEYNKVVYEKSIYD